MPGFGHADGEGGDCAVGELGQAPGAEAGEDEKCCPRLPAELTLKTTCKINQLFRGRRVCLGQASEEGRGACFKAQVTETCGSLLHLRKEQRRAGVALAFRLALQDPDVRCVPSLAICLFVSARSLVRCVSNVLGLKCC